MMNIDNETVAAILALRGNPAFMDLVAAQGRHAHKMILFAADAPFEKRAELLTYAKAHRDWYVTMVSIMEGKRNTNPVPLPDSGVDVTPEPLDALITPEPPAKGPTPPNKGAR